MIGSIRFGARIPLLGKPFHEIETLVSGHVQSGKPVGILHAATGDKQAPFQDVLVTESDLIAEVKQRQSLTPSDVFSQTGFLTVLHNQPMDQVDYLNEQGKTITADLRGQNAERYKNFVAEIPTYNPFIDFAKLESKINS